MKNLNKIKILIVGLTTVLALSNFNNTNFRKGKVYTQVTNLKIAISQSNYYSDYQIKINS